MVKLYRNGTLEAEAAARLAAQLLAQGEGTQVFVYAGPGTNLPNLCCIVQCSSRIGVGGTFVLGTYR